ncbi:MAG: penicillin-binding protein 2 [Candidatus Moranbacteria bacterium]|jgi:penicillin-binding protein 2|nr:penicillin-binding protein 2 [Candidatus Moranbacteria bacterium]
MKLFIRKRIFLHKGGGLEIDDAVLTVTEKDAVKMEWPLNRQISLGLLFGMLAVLAVLGGRVFYLGVVKGDQYSALALRNSLRALIIPAPRGLIYDISGTPLVRNVPSVDLVLIPADVLSDSGDAGRLKTLLIDTFHLDGVTLDELWARLDARSTLPVLLKERLTQEESLLFLSRSHDLPGVSLYKTTQRNYADSLIFSHILGYEGKIKKEELVSHPDYLLTDSIGKQGIEKSYEDVLRGVHGFERVEVDAFGKVKKELGVVQPVPGQDLILNIDAELQKKIFDTLQANLEKNKLSRAAAVAIDPRNGAVRALVSLPSFDNNLFAEGISGEAYRGLINNPSEPLFNRVVAGEYPPGSTIKPVLAAAALSEGVIDERTQIESRGGISIGKFFFGDWKAHGFTDIRRAIAVSSDVFFYSVGGGYGNIRGLGMDRMKKYEELFGYGQPTGIDVGGEAGGLIPDAQWKQEKIGERWYIGDDYHAAIGQGFVTATPLQILNSIVAIANGGTLYAPRIVSQIRSADGKVTVLPPEILRQNFVDSNILRIVREGMRKTVTEGTAQPLQDLPVAVAGKTGTAQFGSAAKTHGWFVSFAPFDTPELSMIVLVEGQGEEGYNAVPVAKEVYQWYFTRNKN